MNNNENENQQNQTPTDQTNNNQSNDSQKPVVDPSKVIITTLQMIKESFNKVEKIEPVKNNKEEK
ncbi:MAG: hypothetical protein IPJ60_12765 [Sphingobacteriaceae bacterium]|nr:hypothetical protein [Sphingobacteriaceae bacterium]